MDSNFYSQLNYEEMLRKNMGLISINSKTPVRDKSSLALVYTPGVGASCKEIEKDHKKALVYTNKLNSMLVVTDSSGLKNYSHNKTNKMMGIPYVEATAAYYKTFANIDCYPLVIDSSLLTSGQELAELVKALMPAYSLIELLGIEEQRLEEFSKHIGKNNFAYITLNKRKIDEERLDGIFGLSAYKIYSLVIRVALDYQVYNSLDEMIIFIIDYLNEHKVHINLLNERKMYDMYLFLLVALGEYVVKNRLSSLEIFQKNYSLNKFEEFLENGRNAWIEQYPANYFSSEHSNDENSLLLHKRFKGIIETRTKIEKISYYLLENWKNLDHISEILSKFPDEAFKITCKSNMAAIITNGTAILGFGDIGPLAGLPVMEGKSVLFKLFGGVDIMPICIDCKDPKKFIKYVRMISPIFAAINLEDIKSPECFEIEQTLSELIEYPVFHDDQHGTAIIVFAGILNSLKLANKKLHEIKIVINGAGAAGLSVTKLLLNEGARDIIICDTNGAIYTGRLNNMNEFKENIAKITNPNKAHGKLSDVIKGADIFIGLSAPNTLSQDMIKSMNDKPIIFALANPTPEIMPNEAKQAGAFIIATGRSDFNNQINNSLAFPGLFRAAIDVRARKITLGMKIAAAISIANLLDKDELTVNKIIPDSLDTRVPLAVSNTVAKEAVKSGVAKLKIDCKYVQENIKGWILEGQLKNWDDINQFMKPKF